MNDVEHDTADSPHIDFPALLDWEEVQQDEREVRLEQVAKALAVDA